MYTVLRSASRVSLRNDSVPALATGTNGVTIGNGILVIMDDIPPFGDCTPPLPVPPNGDGVDMIRAPCVGVLLVITVIGAPPLAVPLPMITLVVDCW